MKKKSLSVKKKNHNLILKHLNDKKILKIFKEFEKSIDVKSKYAAKYLQNAISQSVIE